jgi:hypothetical protein
VGENIPLSIAEINIKNLQCRHWYSVEQQSIEKKGKKTLFMK